MTLSRILLAPALSTVGFAETVSIQGAGATFPAPLYAKWIDAYNKDHTDSHIDYQPIGSGGGIKGITDKTVRNHLSSIFQKLDITNRAQLIVQAHAARYNLN